jgi:hypothetical protein
VLAEKRSGEETTALVTCPVPLPVRMPPKVVEAVPPFATATVPERKLAPMEVVETTLPLALVERSAEARLVKPKEVVVALVVVDWRAVK